MYLRVLTDCKENTYKEIIRTDLLGHLLQVKVKFTL